MADAFRTLVTALQGLPTETYPPAAALMNGLSKVAQIQFGAYTGTGGAITVVTNGDPRMVILVDVTQQCTALHITGMTAAHFFQIDNGGVAHVGAAGITLGTNSFVIGTDAHINTNLDVGFWFAVV
jgi:hypothetical protein